MADDFSRSYLEETAEIARAIDPGDLDRMAQLLAEVRERGGRLFIVGVGGGAGHASHAVNDFRKLCGIEAYAPTDNVSELTARTNDEGWETSFEAWLRTSRLSAADGLLVFSVGGGSREHGISMNVVRAVELASEAGSAIAAIVGKADGTAATEADVAIVVPAPPERITPHTEAFQAVVWHALVTHPALASGPGKWESLASRAGDLSGEPAVFLDRDGLINALVEDPRTGNAESPLDAEQVVILPGVTMALDALEEARLTVVVASNQPAAAKGTATTADLDAVHARVVELLGESAGAIAEWRYCRHHPEAVDPALRTCECRKPAPGLLIDAARDLGLDLPASWMIGDADRDIAAGIAAGCRTILVEHGPSAHRREGRVEADIVAPDLGEAASAVLRSPR